MKHFDMLLPKAKGVQIVSHAEHHEGDGGEGIISIYVVCMCLNLFASHTSFFRGSSSCPLQDQQPSNLVTFGTR